SAFLSDPHPVPLPWVRGRGDKSYDPCVAMYWYSNCARVMGSILFADLRSFFPIACLIRSCIFWTVLSQLLCSARARPFLTRSLRSGSVLSRAFWAAAMNSSAPLARYTMSLHCFTTSRTWVLTMGLPVAMYSRPLVGLMYWVAALMAKHIMLTSKAAQ